MGDVDAKPLVRRALAVSVADGLLHAVMVGACESYLGAFAVELGHRGTSLACLATVPILVGATAQLAAGPLVLLLGNRKRVAVAGALVQAITTMAFAHIATTGDSRLSSLLAAKVAFWVSGSVVSPVWGDWMASLTHGRQRERYFSWRSGGVQVALLLAFLVAGSWLHTRATSSVALQPFVGLFIAAAIARGLSAVALAVQPDPYGQRTGAPLNVLSKVRSAVGRSQWRVAIYLMLVMAGANVAVPFFTPYMLHTLRLHYGAFAGLVAVSLVAKAIFFPLCHRLANRFGLRATLAWGGAGVSVVALLWASSPSLVIIVVAQVIGGVSWSALEYASYQLLLDSAAPEVRVEFLSIAGAVVGVGTVAGAVIGGQLYDVVGATYPQLFFISAVCRAAALIPLHWLPRLMFPTQMARLAWRVLSVRPVGGSVQRPVVASFDEPPP